MRSGLIPCHQVRWVLWTVLWAIPGTASLNDRDLAKFNGLAAIRRQANVFRVEPLYATRFGANAARASSWIRYEKKVPVVAALRTELTGER
ncbi:MAG: hypothetical protein WKF68_12490 [Daejeonella sp.]